MQKSITVRHSLSIPFNGDLDLLDLLDWRNVYEVYGSPTDITINNGRSRKNMAQITTKTLNKAIEICTSNDTPFNVLLNAPYYHPDYLYSNELNDFDEWILSVNNSKRLRFTVTLPQIFNRVIKYIGDADITISKYAQVDSVSKLQRWKDLGANSVIIGGEILKNISTIEKMCQYDVTIGILANDACLLSCPLSIYHPMHSSSHSTDKTIDGYVEYCTDYCKDRFSKNTIDIIRATYIRPEDICEYLSIGVSYVKLVDRNMPTSWIVNVINAYSNKSYNGNFIDLFPLFVDFNGKYGFPYINNKRLKDIFSLQKNHCVNEICQVSCFCCNEVLSNAMM